MSEQDLLAYEMPIQKILEDNSVKEMTEIEDDRFIKGLRYEIPFHTITSETFRPGRMTMRGHIDSKRTVTISKEKLARRLEENRAQHKAIYEEALEGYETALRKALVEAGEKAIELGSAAEFTYVDHNELFASINKLQRPQHSLKAYDEAIQLFDWDEVDQIELTVSEFRHYVLDEWDWRERWMHESAHYSQTARMAMQEM